MSRKLTFGKICEQLNDFLVKFSDSLGIDDDEDVGSRVHPYGPVNLYSELGDILQVTSAIRARCDQLKVSGNGAVNLLKSSITSTDTVVESLPNPDLSLNLYAYSKKESQQQEEIGNPLKNCLKNCAEKLRNATQDLTMKTVIQKLQAISEESCLRFDNGGQSGTDFFISSDMFYFEIKLDTSGKIIDVREQLHSGEPKSCKELVDILRQGNYEEFKIRLKRLADLYKIKVDTFMKSSKIFAALEAVEKDIIRLSQLNTQGNYLKPYEILQTGPIGYVFRRQGGHLMQLNYFANPTDLTDKFDMKIERDEELPTSCRDFGLSLTIAVESSKPRWLPISSLLSIDESNNVHYDIMNNNNSDELPASFVMRLTKPLPIAASLLNEIHVTLTGPGSTDFIHSSESPLDNLIIKQHLNLKSRQDWERKLFKTELPDQKHIYRLCSCDASSNIGFIISRIPFCRPSQTPTIIKLLRRQAVYNALLISCIGKQHTSLYDDTDEYFTIKASSPKTIEVTFQHPLHTSMASVLFNVQPDNTIQTSTNFSSDAPEFCSTSYLDKVANKSLSIPITMRSLLKKASSYIPESREPSHAIKPINEEDQARRKKLKLLIPSLSVESSAPLVSPGILAFPTFSLSSGSPSAAFQFPSSDLTTAMPGAYTKPSFSSPRKHKEALGKPSTPGTPKSRTLKLPKITLKRKRDGDEYEIDKEKSNFDVLEESDAQTIAESLSDESKLDETKSEVKKDVAELSETKSQDVTLTTDNVPIDLSSVEPLPANAISISSVGELEGLLGPAIDVSTLMGENLNASFGITGTSFPEAMPNATVGDNQLEAFDLDAISSVGSHISFDVDDSLDHGVSAADPSMGVSASSTLATTPVFDVNQPLIDIDSFIMGPIPERGQPSLASKDQST
eukprot:gene3747-4270_t